MIQIKHKLGTTYKNIFHLDFDRVLCITIVIYLFFVGLIYLLLIFFRSFLVMLGMRFKNY